MASSIPLIPWAFLSNCDDVDIKILHEEYQVGLLRCKSHLHGRLILSKGDTPLKFNELKEKLTSLWSMIGKWNMISLGRGFYDFAFSFVEDLRRVCARLAKPIIVEREDYAFFVSIEYDNLPAFCAGYQSIGHMASDCRKIKKEVRVEASKPTLKKVDKYSKVPRGLHQDIVINLEIDKSDKELTLERIVSTPHQEGRTN
ncbi:hypothetical protein Lal_00049579 [Lupinus albus]|nr:hypothetical protein Lal_00049579 [Lupinus albus]